MKSKEGIHVLARAVIIDDNKLLVTTDVKRETSFLPGGHVNYGEKITDGLLRELKEELGQEFKIEYFLGAIEAGWDYQAHLYHEINLFFLVSNFDKNLLSNLSSQEAGLRLDWLPLSRLNGAHFYPQVLKEKIPQWLNIADSRFASEWSWKDG